jgi:phage terminase large subunit-like protein
LPVVAAISFADNGGNARDRKVSMLMGKVFLPSDAPWLGEFERELTGFPGGMYDDQVDSTTQALEFLGTKGASAAIWAALAR